MQLLQVSPGLWRTTESFPLTPRHPEQLASLKHRYQLSASSYGFLAPVQDFGLVTHTRKLRTQKLRRSRLPASEASLNESGETTSDGQAPGRKASISTAVQTSEDVRSDATPLKEGSSDATPGKQSNSDATPPEEAASTGPLPSSTVSASFFGQSRKGRSSTQTLTLDALSKDVPSLQDSELELGRQSEVGSTLQRIESSVPVTKTKPADFETSLKELNLALESDDLSSAMGRLRGLNPQVLDALLSSVGTLKEVGIFQRRAAHVLDLALQESDMERVMEAYDWLKAAGVLDSFGKEKENLLTAEPRLVTPDVLKAFSGLEASQLSPKRWGSSNSLAPLAFLGVFAALTNNGVDVRPLALIALVLAIVDSTFLGGAGQAQVMSLWPGYKRRVLVHEAGHVLVAYLLGCPVRGVVLDAFTAMDMGIQGQAGTQFWDSSLDFEMKTGKLTGASVDRYSVVLFAGIAAEALVYGEAEGGESDENLFKALVGSLEPKWTRPKVANQARWAVLQAHTLLRDNKPALDAIVSALEEKKPMGDIALAIESTMSSLRT